MADDENKMADDENNMADDEDNMADDNNMADMNIRKILEHRNMHLGYICYKINSFVIFLIVYYIV